MRRLFVRNLINGLIENGAIARESLTAHQNDMTNGPAACDRVLEDLA
jgi:hypothetical protein